MLWSMPRRSRDVPAEYTDVERALAREIGARVCERRKELGLTQVQIRARVEAEGVHISRTQYSRIELGRSLLNAAEIIALAQVLEVSDRWLLRGQS